MSFLAYIITWINVPLNAAGKFLLAPVGLMPGWLSNTIIAAVTGVILLIIFKYTSNQKKIGKVKNDIKANMLALKLFKDSILITLKAQKQVFKGALLLLCYAIVPLIVMIVPVSLLLAQMGLWYQVRPLRIGEEAVVTVKLNDDKMRAAKKNTQIVKDNPQSLDWPQVSIESLPAAEVTIGPVRASSKRQLCWNIKAQQNGYHRIVFEIDDKKVEKELAVGDGFMRVSVQRPSWNWADILLYPSERPFGHEEVVQSISIDYPDRISWTSGTDWWVIYFFGASIVFGLLFKPFLKVKI